MRGMLLHPQQTDVGGRSYTLHKFPATVGREILMQYPTSAMPKIGDYKTNHSLMLRIMSYVTTTDGIQLQTETLVNNHVPDAETLIRLEWAMIQYNYDFFTDGRGSDFLKLIASKIASSSASMLKDSLQPSQAKS